MKFEEDRTDTALDPAGIAWALSMFGQEAQGTIGEVAGLVLCTSVDEETGRPENVQIASQFDALCHVIAEQLRQEPARALFRREQGTSLWLFRGDATLMMKAALSHVRPWHGAILELWARRPRDVDHWIESKLPLYVGESAWMDACQKEIESGHVVALQRATAEAKPSSRVAEEIQVLRTLVVRMFLAGLRKAGGEERAVWRQLGFDKADRRDIEEVFELRAVEFRDVDASKRHVSVAMVDVLGEAFVRERYPYIHARYLAELAQVDRKG